MPTVTRPPLGTLPWILLGGALLGGAGCSVDDERAPLLGSEPSGPEIPYARLPATSAAFREVPCRGRWGGYTLQCGVVTVPESPGSERSVELSVLRVFSTSTDPAADPVVYLDGGPGAPGTATVLEAIEAFEPILRERDLITLDQRGTGDSAPALRCPEVGQGTGDLSASLAHCYQRLSEHSDLSAYTTAQAVQDLDSVRQALGYPLWNLYGISYGTRVGLTALRDTPSALRSVILDGVVPLQVDLLGEVGRNGYRALLRVFEACAAEPACAQAHPEPEHELLGVLQRLRDEPETAPFSGDAVVELLFELMYAPAGIGYIPKLIGDLAQDDFTLLEAFAEATQSALTLGVYLSVQCADEMPFTSTDAIAALDEEVPELLRPGLSAQYAVDLCAAWPVRPSAPLENEPVQSDVPVLVVSGEFDPITPPRFGALVHAGLTRSQHVEIGGESHGATVSACGGELLSAFLLDPAGPALTACAEGAGPIDFRGVPAAGRRGVRVAGAVRFYDERPDAETWRAIVEQMVLRRGPLALRRR